MHVVKIVEIIGSSPEGWKEAAEAALKELEKVGFGKPVLVKE